MSHSLVARTLQDTAVRFVTALNQGHYGSSDLHNKGR